MDDVLRLIFKEALALTDIDAQQIREDSSIVTVKGWDSLGHLRLIAALEKTYGITIDPLEAIDLVDVTAIQNLVSKKKSL
ncbi:MAG: acyl carrier protein [Candidatus Omnitrophica bacterium]|nr:acyl carrier protein [Candidatus Omnitrophota bacterium]